MYHRYDTSSYIKSINYSTCNSRVDMFTILFVLLFIEVCPDITN
jgi:hypothetical protein